ncbi:MAG TPA: PDR/VanB family oxidoreductase [Caldimonas sp.]
MNAAPTPLIEVRVARKTVEAEDIAGFELAAADGGTLPSFAAGAHIDVHLPGGLQRQYSLCNAPGETHRYCIGVLRDPASRGGSVAMHELVHEGTRLAIGAPKNHFALHEDAARSLLFAGGIGVTPILAMAERLSATDAEFEMHYCTRSPARTAYAQRLRDSRFADRVHFHFDDGPPQQKLDLAQRLRAPKPDTRLYVCGPSGFLDAVRATARDCGWSDAQIHFEYFSGVAPHSAEDRSFDVVINSSGKVIRVAAAQTITEALAEHGVFVPVSCQQGVCGTCLTRVIEGAIDHKDLYLSPEERAANDQFLPCCSRAAGSRLVLDL